MSSSLGQFVLCLAVASLMVALTVTIHFWGLLFLTRIVSGGGARLHPHKHYGHAALVILMGVFGVFALHAAEIWCYAALYRGLGEISEFEHALYFSTTTFSSLGFGDIVLSSRWRMVSAIEGSNGFILFAWSTTFLMTLTGKLRLLEHEWLEHGTDQ